MQAVQRLHLSRPIRLRIVRVILLRWLRARLREESPIIDRIAPDVEDRSGLGPLQLR
jgi:hypothetical protein